MAGNRNPVRGKNLSWPSGTKIEVLAPWAGARANSVIVIVFWGVLRAKASCARGLDDERSIWRSRQVIATKPHQIDRGDRMV